MLSDGGITINRPSAIPMARRSDCSTLVVRLMPHSDARSRIARCEVRYNRKQVLLVEIGHDLGHQRAPFSCSRAVLEIIELPEHVAWRTTGDARQRSKPFQVGAVAQRALDCFARPTFHYQLLAFGEAPDRDICRIGRP